jgi:hypothetical protein
MARALVINIRNFQEMLGVSLEDILQLQRQRVEVEA